MSFNPFPPLNITIRFLIILALFGLVNISATDAKEFDLENLTLEQLMDIEIISVSKKEQKISEAPAAIYVITQEDIRRSGATSIAEALRMAPGVNVARISAHKWAISIRGFQDQLAGKLLVMMDGRSVYTHTFSGSYWDVQDYLLEDIDRIEIIRGPGATMWGANAVNGVINIITKSAKDTQGVFVTVGGGDEARAIGGLRYGGQQGEMYYRVYAKYIEQESFLSTVMDDVKDDWDMWRSGFRVDWEASEQDHLTFQGDLYYADIHQKLWLPNWTPPAYQLRPYVSDKVTGGNLLGRWTRTLSDTSDFSLQAYYDRAQRNDTNADDDLDTIDLNFQHTFQLGERHSLIWGLGYRRVWNDIRFVTRLFLDPAKREDNLFNFFLQDEITLIEDQLKLTLGSKFEHNDYTGFEIQPSARLLWTPTDRQRLWASVSRAIRSPNRVDEDLVSNVNIIPSDTFFPGQPVGNVRLLGNDDVDSEEMIAYELGYRIRATTRLEFDLAGFYNDYDDLMFLGDGVMGTPFVDPTNGHFIVPIIADNVADGVVYGYELATNWRPLDCWRLAASYSYLDMDLGSSPNGQAKAVELRSPQNQFNLRSFLTLPYNIDLDAALYYVDELKIVSAVGDNFSIPDYTRVDVRLSWRPRENLELSMVGQNILDPEHREHFEFTYGTPSVIERSVYGKLTWKF
jgi:iron complex outermembrane recepter protein